MNETAPDNEQSAFVLSDKPIVAREDREARATRAAAEFEDLGDLPRSYGTPLVIVIARDPHTLFAYWDIDWVAAFADEPPPDRTVILRVVDREGAELSRRMVEPLAGSCYVDVAQSDSSYGVELGYYNSTHDWKSVARSEPVITPREAALENGDFQLATIPLHLRFQQIVDALRGSRFDAHTLATALGELQLAMETSGDGNVVQRSEAQLLETIGWSPSETEMRTRAQLRGVSISPGPARARLQRILGFGATSPATSNGGGS